VMRPYGARDSQQTKSHTNHGHQACLHGENLLQGPQPFIRNSVSGVRDRHDATPTDAVRANSSFLGAGRFSRPDAGG
jgi:hypothetical protein